jgi:hypothetical protein
MNYTYQLCWDRLGNKLAGCILRVEDQLFISPDPANRAFAEYLAWVEAGNSPLPAPDPEPHVVLSPSEKLAASGLTVAELKTLLGLEVTP